MNGNTKLTLRDIEANIECEYYFSADDATGGISTPPVVDGRADVMTFYDPIISIVEYPQNGDRAAAVRRAIVRAAAAIGEKKYRIYIYILENH